MKILFSTNIIERGPCGVAEFGDQNIKALVKAGHEVVVWEPTLENHWPDLMHTGDFIIDFDVVHLNYHAGTIGFVQPPPVKPKLLSAFIHEPASGHWFGEADVLFSAEDFPGHVKMFMPVPDVPEQPGPDTDLMALWRAATSTLRSAGVDWAAPALKAAGITFDHGQSKDHWYTMEEEVNRLAAADFLIYWYGGANPGQSAGVMTGVAAQRPIVLNSNRMFDSLREYDDELYRAETPEAGIEAVVRDLRAGTARIPRRLRADRSWANAVKIMEAAWNV